MERHKKILSIRKICYFILASSLWVIRIGIKAQSWNQSCRKGLGCKDNEDLKILLSSCRIYWINKQPLYHNCKIHRINKQLLYQNY